MAIAVLELAAVMTCVGWATPCRPALMISRKCLENKAEMPGRRHMMTARQGKSEGPARSVVIIDDVGAATAFLAHNAACLITGETLYIDGGYHIID